MAIRTNAEDVKAILPDGVATALTDSQALVFITSANVVVTDNCTGQGLSDALLEEIEKYAAAHFIMMTKFRQAESKKIGQASEKYGTLGADWMATTYGQLATSLDSSGMLKKSGLKKVRFEVVPSFDDSLVLDL